MSYSRSPRPVRWTTVGIRGMAASFQIARTGRPQGPSSLGRVSAALLVTGLTKRYGDDRAERRRLRRKAGEGPAPGGFLALDDFDLEVPAGRFFGLLGPNGAGKTTLISAVCNIIRVTSGTIDVFGEPHHTIAAPRLVRVR